MGKVCIFDNADGFFYVGDCDFRGLNLADKSDYSLMKDLGLF